ncbi:MAG: CDP-alcohol phosphatidyltransferase family protein [Pseudomonadota bacterium]|nr:CDP-alcohol phosphatidyltransferase family protein [Pseudomonadota bacterium]
MSQNTWTHRLARRLVRPLVDTAVTPNHLTTLRLLTGLGAVALFALGSRGGEVWGGVLFVLSAFLDRADGELARIGGRTSPGGHIYDLLCDALVTALLFVGIGIGLRHGPLGGWAVLLGMLAGGAVAFIFWLLARLDDDPFAGAGGFDPDDLLYLVGPLAWLGWLQPFLLAAGAGAPAFAAWAAWRHRPRRKVR